MPRIYVLKNLLQKIIVNYRIFICTFCAIFLVATCFSKVDLKIINVFLWTFLIGIITLLITNKIQILYMYEIFCLKFLLKINGFIY